ncbi:SAM-dependent methyltransferase [Streptomyces sp. NBC_01803]|uniref:SAM-dependent methyltransferase n=1 Tax=Streptomyces sp. NBC_01803 TaxID=2975946 RepID=UPI002DD9C659|nr:SAM-dependent methyltransferase [Streptomyces sp. NBC_01803]WSA43242.1 SAM-dependent methyltransferase [Streptomyces sp. NBC_01803]
MELPAWAPPGMDLSVPSVSRMYDYYLGGSHNFEVDRAAARKALEAFPGIPKIAQANRAFMRRAVRHAISEGVTQFLDIGSGVPTFGNVHEVAQEASDRARVVYVDNDPVAVAHSRAVLAGDDRADVASADFRDPQGVLNSDPVGRLLDLDRPVALLLVALLHFFEDDDKPGEKVAALRDSLAAGSLLILTHASVDHGSMTPEQGARITRIYRDGGATLVMRSGEDIARFFDGFELVDPGLVPMPDWRPEGPPDQEDPIVYAGYAGVGRKA